MGTRPVRGGWRTVSADRGRALERQVKDPRLGMVTITDTRVTADLREATLYYTVSARGRRRGRRGAAAALESANGVLRSEVGRQTGVQFTPTLAFVADAVPDQARDRRAARHRPGRRRGAGAPPGRDVRGRPRPVPGAARATSDEDEPTVAAE